MTHFIPLILAPLAALLYGLGLVVYRLYFHPLAKFPGPKLAAATGWYEAYHDTKGPGGQFIFKLRELHKTYGPIVRLSPDELHVNDSAWLDTLFASSAQGVRDKYVPAASQAGTPNGVLGTAVHNTHRRRRAALSPLFSKACAAGAEGLIYDKLDLLLKCINARIARDGYAEMRTEFMNFTTDIVSEYCLGESFGLLHDEAKGQNWHRSIRALAKTIPYARQFNWIIPLSQMIPISFLKVASPDMAGVAGMHHDMEALAVQAVKEHEQAEKEKKVLELPFHRSPRDRLVVYRSLLENEGLPPHERHYKRISHEAVTLMAAGGETTTSTFMTGVYFILANKDRILPKLREEIESVMHSSNSRPSVADLERLPWLTAVIKETLRISTLTARLTRVAPEEALQLQDWTLPPGTPVSMTLHEISFDPEIFPSPREFRPERWLPSNPDLERCNRYLVAFSRGSRICMGMNLAYAELYITFAALFRHGEFELYDTVRERDVDFTRDFFVGETSAAAKGVRIRYANPST
ncbi:putative cytochrome P450 [Rosellinia necatrix]|uniref:Putative cytochrome P450 n=1 Tax=Rosellinia necatrix TaxID=77044 RepID=A0A1W2TJJ1_ROSNE|nr:putative cytochrome P450 [Rosellinia necatrix]